MRDYAAAPAAHERGDSAIRQDVSVGIAHRIALAVGEDIAGDIISDVTHRQSRWLEFGFGAGGELVEPGARNPVDRIRDELDILLAGGRHDGGTAPTKDVAEVRSAVLARVRLSAARLPCEPCSTREHMFARVGMDHDIAAHLALVREDAHKPDTTVIQIPQGMIAMLRSGRSFIASFPLGKDVRLAVGNGAHIRISIPPLPETALQGIVGCAAAEVISHPVLERLGRIVAVNHATSGRRVLVVEDGQDA